MFASYLFKRRRIFWLGGAGAVGLLSGGAVTAGIMSTHMPADVQVVKGGVAQGDEPYLHPGTFDQQFLARSADVKQIWDFTSTEQIQSDGFNAIKNALNDFQFVYRRSLYPVVDLRSSAVIYSLDDVMWQKYGFGTLLGQKNEHVANNNPRYHRMTTGDEKSDPNDINSLYQDSSLQALQLRGMHIAVCHQALKAFSTQFADRYGLAAQSVFEEWVNHLIPGAQQTPSGSSLIAVAQHLGFTYAKQ